MMELLPHQGWSDVARTRDLQALERSLNDRITAESALLRAEMAEMRGELRNEMTVLRSDLTDRFSVEFSAFRDELHRDQRTLQRQIILALVIALLGVVVAAAGLR